MCVRIIDNGQIACLYDSVSDVAFGPVFYGLDESEAGTDVSHDEMAKGFLKYLKQDARTYTAGDLEYEYDCYRNAIELSGWEAVSEEVESSV